MLSHICYINTEGYFKVKMQSYHYKDSNYKDDFTVLVVNCRISNTTVLEIPQITCETASCDLSLNGIFISWKTVFILKRDLEVKWH